MAKTQLTRKNGSKWQKRSLLVKMAQNGKNEAGLLVKMGQNGKNAAYSKKLLKMADTGHS